jgi:cob(I)alamin adenosyltransferase
MVTKITQPITVFGNEAKESLGMTHIITGTGKGKTTAAIGLGIRATGYGYRVYMVQFLKSGMTGELYAIKNNSNFTIEQFGVDAIKERQKSIQEFTDKTARFIFQPDELERDAAKHGWEHAKKVINSEEYEIVILDEINCVLDKKLIPIEEVIEIIKKGRKTEIIMTGRDAPKELQEHADYISEITAIKHPWERKIKARKGVEY